MTEPFIFLTYLYQGYKFDFARDEIYITDLRWKRKYKLSFNYGDESVPFVIQLIEKL